MQMNLMLTANFTMKMNNFIVLKLPSGRKPNAVSVAVIMMARRMISLENSKTSLEKFHRIKEDRKLGLMK